MIELPKLISQQFLVLKFSAKKTSNIAYSVAWSPLALFCRPHHLPFKLFDIPFEFCLLTSIGLVAVLEAAAVVVKAVGEVKDLLKVHVTAAMVVSTWYTLDKDGNSIYRNNEGLVRRLTAKSGEK